MNFEISQWGNSTFRLVATRELATLGQVDHSLTTPFVQEVGVILFRGFQTDLDQISDFVERHSVRVTLDPARAFHAKNVQKVDAGVDAIGLHCENAVAPLPPEYIWFYCERAARKGSQTTVCDGVHVWDKVSDETRDLLSTHRIKYARTFIAAAWKKWVAAEHPTVKSEDAVTETHLLELVSQMKDQKVEPLGDGRVYTEFCVPAVHKTISGQWALANSLLGPSYNYEAPRITTDDDRALPESVWADLRRVTGELTENIEWRDGDVALIDNMRVMHGRRRIEDPERRLYAALSTAR
jgi:alpha-ketoglutarate-dependent taurine dioxygenase